MGRRGKAARRGAIAGCGAVALTFCALLISPAIAAATLSWSPVGVIDNAGSGPAVSAIACPTADSCSALTVDGGAVNFDPANPLPSTPVAVASAEPLAETCVSATACVSVDLGGGETTFNPAAPAAGQTVTIDPGNALTAVACASAATCVAVDTAGQEVTFTPGETSTAGNITGTIDSTTNAILTGVSCFAAPSAQQADCVAVDDAGLESTFNSQTGQSTGQSTVEFNGSSSSNTLTAITCPTGSSCLAFDANGTQIEFDPADFTGTVRNTVDSGQDIIAAACATATLCTAIDSAGGEVSFVPLGSTGPQPTSQPPRQVLTAAANLTDVACPQAGLCVAVNAAGDAIDYAPDPQGSGAVAAPALLDAAHSYSAVGCAGTAQCTAADRDGDVVSFDPASGSPIAHGTVDPGAVTVYGIACPASTQCTLVDQNGTEVTFDPQSPGSPTAKQLVTGHPLLSIACPSAAQCTAVDDDQDEITFDPAAPGDATFAVLGAAAGTPITGVACPSTTQCTAVDGTGGAITFNPQSPGKPAPHAVVSNNAAAVSCPSRSECVAISAGGERATFNPLNPAGTTTTATVDKAQPDGLSCSTATLCTEIDSSGNAVEFDPYGTGPSASRSVGAAGTLTGLTCAAATTCVAVDSAALAYVSTGTLPSAPGFISAPKITGHTEVGYRLTASMGNWTNEPTGHAVQWERCTKTGGRCTAIAGAVEARYVPVAADAGHRLKVSVAATNPGGMASSRLSAATAVISGRPAPPKLTKVNLTVRGKAAAHRPVRVSSAQLAVTVTAAAWGPQPRTLVVGLPAGLRFKPAKGRAAATKGIVVTAGGHRQKLSVRLVDHRLQITLRRAVRSLRLTLRSPQLTVTGALARRLIHHVRTRRVLAVTLTTPRQPSQRATIAWRAI